MTTETIHLLTRQLNELECCVRKKAETRNIPREVREAIREAADALVAAQRLLSEVRPA
jgi:hypothetical protein